MTLEHLIVKLVIGALLWIAIGAIFRGYVLHVIRDEETGWHWWIERK